MRILYLFLTMALALLAAVPACRRKDGPRGGPAADSAESRPGRIAITLDTCRLWVEVADRPDTRQVGLMFRRSMPEDEGMLFVFESPQVLEFWMRNTYLPLDIAFVSSDGIIINIETMRPLDDGPRYRSKGQARYAVETNQGWFRRHGVEAGDRLRF